MELGTIQTITANSVTTITFSHPASNALPGVLLRQLAQAIETAGQNPDSVVIVLQSGGDRAFCAGANFAELAAIETQAQGQLFFSGFAGVINACRCCPKLIVGRVQGKAVGGGVGLAAAVDYAIASTTAAIRLSELLVGIGPFVVGPAIERKIGLAAFSQLTLNPETSFSAQWATEKGLYNELHESIESLNEAVLKKAHELAAYNPDTLRELKKVFWQGTDHWQNLLVERAAVSGRLVLSEATKTAIGRFKV
jgi:methylglutaconyl-CoA hydratase